MMQENEDRSNDDQLYDSDVGKKKDEQQWTYSTQGLDSEEVADQTQVFDSQDAVDLTQKLDIEEDANMEEELKGQDGDNDVVDSAEFGRTGTIPLVEETEAGNEEENKVKRMNHYFF